MGSKPRSQEASWAVSLLGLELLGVLGVCVVSACASMSNYWVYWVCVLQ